jgi:hypothetical protein
MRLARLPAQAHTMLISIVGIRGLSEVRTVGMSVG